MRVPVKSKHAGPSFSLILLILVTTLYCHKFSCFPKSKFQFAVLNNGNFYIIINLGLNARRSPMSHLFLTRSVSQLLGLALVSWAFARIGVHRPSLRLPYLVFSIRCYLPLDFNRVSTLRPTYCPFGLTFSHFR